MATTPLSCCSELQGCFPTTQTPLLDSWLFLPGTTSTLTSHVAIEPCATDASRLLQVPAHTLCSFFQTKSTAFGLFTCNGPFPHLLTMCVLQDCTLHHILYEFFTGCPWLPAFVGNELHSACPGLTAHSVHLCGRTKSLEPSAP